MSFLSDITIKALCLPPAFMVKEQMPVFETQTANGLIGPKMVQKWRFSSPGEDEKYLKDQISLSALRERMTGASESSWGIVEFRPITPEDLSGWAPMIAPFITEAMGHDHLHRNHQMKELREGTFNGDEHANVQPIIPYGLNSYSYGLRCGNDFQVRSALDGPWADPKSVCNQHVMRKKVDPAVGYIAVSSQSVVCVQAVETLRIPRDVTVLCVPSQQYELCGVHVSLPPIEPEWVGRPLLTFYNTSARAAKIYAGEGCVQLFFAHGDRVCESSYADRTIRHGALT